MAVGKPLLTPDEWEDAARNIKRCTKLAEALSEAGLVIEAVPEDLQLKRKVFKQINSIAPPETILTTNSSSIPISRIGERTD